jgi:hypothetical protein
MPRYRVRLNDPESEHFRVTYISAASPEEAAAKVMELDAKLVEFRLEPDEFETATKGQLATHNQTHPYELGYVVERGEAIPGGES